VTLPSEDDEAEQDERSDSESARTLEERRRLESIDASYAAARKAVGLARAYRREPGSSGRRERECIEEVRAAPLARGAEILGLRKADALGSRPAQVVAPKRAG
jgi:hypothetical protein